MEVIAVGCFYALLSWCGWCSHRTYQDRMQLLHDSSKPHYAKMAGFARVSYERHLWQRLTFRDWKKLYEPEEVEW